MGPVLALITAVLLLFPVPGAAQDSRATLEAASKALGADGLKTIQYSASGVSFAIDKGESFISAEHLSSLQSDAETFVAAI